MTLWPLAVQDEGEKMMTEQTQTCKQFGVFLMHQIGQVSTVVQDHVERLTVLEVDGLLYAPHILFIGLSLPGIHYNAQTHTLDTDIIV